MNWSLVPLPAPEEIAFGYVPSTHRMEDTPTNAPRWTRRIVTVFLIVAAIAGLRLAGIETDEAGQRRLAEITLPERKTDCRTCDAGGSRPHA